MQAGPAGGARLTTRPLVEPLWLFSGLAKLPVPSRLSSPNTLALAQEVDVACVCF